MNQDYVLKSISDVAQGHMREDCFQGPVSDLCLSVFTPRGLSAASEC